jgi:hypothetical protein
MCVLDLTGTGQGLVAGSYEYGYESSGSVQSRRFLY